jgi:glycosyltransferase involved in cell wall biosynthesis
MTKPVSIIVPCLNENSTISGLLESVYQQQAKQSQIELIIVDGGSTDGTLETVSAFSKSHPELELRIVPNPDRIIPAALNRGIEAATGDLIIRLDAHSAPAVDYVKKCIDTLERTGAANVGGQWRIEPGSESWQAQSIAAAASHPLGAGDARYRISGEEGPVDTVPFGAFRREWLDRVGPFNENLLTNEDYEFNLRLRRAGGVVWFNPAIEATYYSRSTFLELARQYGRYGYWKAQMLKQHPDSLRWRQALPPLFVLVLFALLLTSWLSPAAAALLALQLGSYGTILLLVGMVQALRRRKPALVFGFPLAVTIMHLAWGGSLLYGLIRSPKREPDGT